MKYLAALAATLALVPTAVLAGAVPQPPSAPVGDVNPYLGKAPFAPKTYAKKLDATIKTFLKAKDFLNAANTRTVKGIPTFAWVSSTANVRLLYFFLPRNEIPGISRAFITDRLTDAYFVGLARHYQASHQGCFG